MALRSVARKLPALALRSPAMGPAVRALSPAAGSRLISQRAQTEDLSKAMEAYRREVDLSSAYKDEALRRCKEECQIYKNELYKVQMVCDLVLLACPVVLLAVCMMT